MHKLTLPINTSDLNLLMVPSDDKQEVLLSISVSSALIEKIVKWMNELLPVYSHLFGEEETTKPAGIITTMRGLWQLKILSNYGSTYTTSLRRKLLDNEDDSDVLLLARRVNERLPSDASGLNVGVILGHASSLITSGTWKLPPPLTDLQPKEYTQVHKTNHITYALISILSTMCYRIVEELTVRPEVDAYIIDELSRISKLTKNDSACDFEPLLFLCDLVDANFKANIKLNRTKKIASLNLRVL